jgi:hypothetical protein
LEEKYKALEEKHKALEDNFLKDQNIVDSSISIMEVLDDVSEDKVYDVADMLSKTQYQTPSLEELKL